MGTFRSTYKNTTGQEVEYELDGLWRKSAAKEIETDAYGVVVSGPRLLGAEDSEIIAGGINSKGAHNVALAREANLFSWGPPGRPSEMNEEARSVFVNTIVYMKQFDGAKQTVWRGRQGRVTLREVLDRKDLGFETNTLKWAFTPETIARLGKDKNRYREFYLPNLDYIRIPHGTEGYDVDEEAKSIGIANNKADFLDKCIGLLNQPGEAAKARRLLERYTTVLFRNAQEWRQWFDTNRDKLYFSDYYDYHFYAGPAGPPPTAEEVQWAMKEIRMDEPNETAPLTLGTAAVGYVLTRDYQKKTNSYLTEKGGLVTLAVRLKIADGWHAYARVPVGGGNDVTKIDVKLPEGARWHGEWQMPEAYDGAMPGVKEYRGDVVFTRQLYFTSVPKEEKSSGEGTKMTIKGSVHYQTCNEERCLPPADIAFEAAINVLDR